MAKSVNAGAAAAPNGDGNLALVGCHKIIASQNEQENVENFYGDLFSRLPYQVEFKGNVIRYVGFRATLGMGRIVYFLGAEVDRVERIPPGMSVWQLSDSDWKIWDSQSGENEFVAQHNIEWQWLHRDSASNEIRAGEFSAHHLPEFFEVEFQNKIEFSLAANAYFDKSTIDSFEDSIYLVDYDPAWPEKYQEFATWLRERLGSDVALRIEHYGSTAIPGMPAKPVIDVLVEIPSFAEAKQRAIAQFNNDSWEYWWFSEHIFFLRRSQPMGQRTHHLHMAPANHDIWQGLVFRDYLREHPEDAKRYAELKKTLAAELGRDREAYTRAKTDFVNAILEKSNL